MQEQFAITLTLRVATIYFAYSFQIKRHVDFFIYIIKIL